MLDKYLHNSRVVDSITAQMAMREAYDIQYGLCDHNATSSPFALVSLHPKERFFEYSRYRQTIVRYRMYNVWDYYKVSLLDFLKLPIDLVEEILDDCSEANELRQKRLDEVKAQAEQGMNKI